MSVVDFASGAGIGAGVNYREVYYKDKKYKVASGNYCTPFAKRVGLGVGSSARRFSNHFLVRATPIHGGNVVTKTTDSGPQDLKTSVNANDVPISNQLKTEFTNTKENVEATPVPLEVREDEMAKPEHTNPLNPGGGSSGMAHLKRSAAAAAANPPFRPDSNKAVQAAAAAAVPQTAAPLPLKKRKVASAGAGGGRGEYYRFHVV